MASQNTSAEKINLINGNHQPYSVGLPRLVIQGRLNPVALEHVRDNTGLEFKPTGYDNLEAQPVSSNQIAALFLTYNFKTRYYNNATYKNTLFLRFDHHVGFDVSSICFECVKANHIHVGDLKDGDRLSC